MEMFKVDLYIRVSTERQAKEGDSLEEQESELKKFCEYRDFQINNIFIERGKSGGNTNRPEYQKLIKDIQAQKINAVVVKKLDRLSRSLLDFENLMKIMQEKEVEFISLKESFDTTTAMGKAMLRVALVFAQLEREQTSERLSDVMAFRAKQGMFNGGYKPFGYTNVNKELVPYKKEKEVVEIIFEKYIETKSTTATAKLLNLAGYRNRQGKPWDKRRMQEIIQNPRYIGQVLWNGETHDGIHEPIISKQQFEQAQEIFEANRRITDSPKTLGILQKILFCGACNSPLTPSHSLNRNKVKYFYYRCTTTHSAEKGKSKCSVKYVPFEKVEVRVKEILLSLSQEEHFRPVENRILKFNQAIEQDTQQLQKEIFLLENQLQTLKDKKERYLDSLISSKFLSKERNFINDKINDLELEEKQIKGQMLHKQFEINKKQEEKIDVAQFKKKLITFRVEHEEYDLEQMKKYLTGTIQSIHYTPEKLVFQFNLLPWSIEFESRVGCQT